MDFHGRAAEFKPYINFCDAKPRMQWCEEYIIYIYIFEIFLGLFLFYLCLDFNLKPETEILNTCNNINIEFTAVNKLFEIS